MNPQELRSIAEQRCAKVPHPIEPVKSPQEVLHELQVHEIELEMQNDALRQAQVALEHSRERYIDLYEFAPVGYLTLTRTGLVTEANLAAATMMCVERGALIDRRFVNFVTDADSDRWHREFFRAFKSDGEVHFNVALKRQDNLPFQVHVSCRSVNLAEQSASMRVVLTDINVLKRAEEEKLRENAARLTTIFNGAPDGILIFDLETGQLVDGNPSACTMLGYERDDLLHLNVAALHATAEMSKVLDAANALPPGRTTTELEISVRRKDGISFPAAISVSRLEINGRNCVMGFGRDISERKRAEAALRESEWTLRTALEYSPNAIFILGADSKCCFVNIAAQNLLGYRQDELLQKADTAMYQAKAAGGNRAYFFKPELQASIERRRTAE